MPHGTCLNDIVLEPGNVLRLWSTDLPQYYYRLAVSEERARSNIFTDPIDANSFKDTEAVQRLLKSEGRFADSDAGHLCFAMSTTAMGDVSATTFGQQGHVALLRRHGAMQPPEMLSYRGVPPKGPTYEGVVDDHSVC